MEITQNIITEFLNFYKNNGYKEKTLQRFSRDIQKFHNYLIKIGINTIEGITTKSIEDYKYQIIQQPVPKTSRYYGESEKIASKTVEEKIQTIKNFLKFTNYIYNLGIHCDLVRVPKGKSKRMDFFTYNEIQQIVELINESKDYEINKARLKLHILIGFTTGLRLAEVMRLKASDIERGSTVVITKGDKDKQVFFSKNIRKLMDEYLKLRDQPLPWIGRKAKNTADDVYVLVSHHPHNFGQPCVKSTICRQFKKYSKMLNIEHKNFSSHTLRHSCATHLLDNEINLRYIQDILGHVHLTTTQLYLHTHNSKLKKIQEEIMDPIEI